MRLEVGGAVGAVVAVGAAEGFLAGVGHQMPAAVALVSSQLLLAHRTREAVVVHAHVLLQIYTGQITNFRFF